MEPVVTAVIEALRDGLAGAAAAINAGLSDMIEIRAPHESAYLLGIDPGELESETLQLADPSVIVRGEDTTPKPDSGNPALGGEYALDNAVVVSVLFQAPTLEERVKLTWRYQRAVCDVLLPDPDLGATFLGSGYLERTIPSGVWRDAVCLFNVDSFETP